MESIISDRCRYSCLATMVHHMAAKYEDPATASLATVYWDFFDQLVRGLASDDAVKAFIEEHVAETYPEDGPMRKVFRFLREVDLKEHSRYLSLNASDRREYVESTIEITFLLVQGGYEDPDSFDGQKVLSPKDINQDLESLGASGTEHDFAECTRTDMRTLDGSGQEKPGHVGD